MGLRIMNYRANTIGAILEIKALDKSGTLVVCTVPVNNGSRLAARRENPSSSQESTDEQAAAA
jgi:hypothetical protein